MGIYVRQLSDMLKVRSRLDMGTNEISSCTLFKGESFSYQISIHTDEVYMFDIEIESELKEYIKIYEVKNVIMDYAAPANTGDLITNEPGIMPDMLMPIENQNGYFRLSNGVMSFWVYLKLPSDIEAKKYDIKINIKASKVGTDEISEHCMSMEAEVLEDVLLNQELKYSEWLHADCIASFHKCEIYSDKHWYLLDKYMSLASELGINTILTPIVTPPVDTKKGTARPCVQLVKINYECGKYSFDFSLFEKWVQLCNKHNMKYFEMAHLFSQGGPKYTPNILVEEDGRLYYKFNSSVSYDSPEYADFLKAFLTSLIKEVESLGIKEKCIFHISDEPVLESLESYGYAYSLIKPLIGDCPIMDALSDPDFYDNGYMDIPVTITFALDKFLPKNIPEQWAYYCMGPANYGSNRFLSMPSYRNRIIGLQLYKYDIKGFLHWGYNYYYSRDSIYEINPFCTTSADKSFPSGDPFSVYPYRDDALPSLRAYVFKKALEDISVCKMLEKYIGKEKVVELIENEAGMEITFNEYPRNNVFIPNLINKMKAMIAKYDSVN